MQRKLESIHHIIVCGSEETENKQPKKLLAYNRPFVIIEKNEEVIGVSDEILYYFKRREDEIL